MTASESNAVGPLLRAWRTSRGMSQLALSLEAGVSSRHLSFIETGRSSPSREMVLTLAEALDMPLRERNALLEAAGYAAVYRETPFDARPLDQVREALAQVLRASEPNPTLVVNRRYDVLMANAAATRLVGFFCERAPDPARPLNLARLIVSREGLRPSIRNWAEVATYVVDRIRRELAAGRPGDAATEELLRELADDAPSPALAARAPGGAFVPVRLKRGETAMQFFTAITTLGTPLDITLQELRVETFFAADVASGEALRRLVGD